MINSFEKLQILATRFLFMWIEDFIYHKLHHKPHVQALTSTTPPLICLFNHRWLCQLTVHNTIKIWLRKHLMWVNTRGGWRKKSIFIIQVTVAANKKLCVSSFAVPQKFLSSFVFLFFAFHKETLVVADSMHVCFIIIFTMYEFHTIFPVLKFTQNIFQIYEMEVFICWINVKRSHYSEMHLASSMWVWRWADADVNYLLFLFSSEATHRSFCNLFFILLSVNSTPLWDGFVKRVTDIRGILRESKWWP